MVYSQGGGDYKSRVEAGMSTAIIHTHELRPKTVTEGEGQERARCVTWGESNDVDMDVVRLKVTKRTRFALLPTIYRSLTALWAQNRKKELKEVFMRLPARSVKKAPTRSESPEEVTPRCFWETFRPFRDSFDTPGRKSRKTLLRFFAVFGLEGRETPANGWQERNTCCLHARRLSNIVETAF